MKGFCIIVATDAVRGIGKDGQIPWHLSRDMQHFKEITTASYVPGRKNVVIMGRKTWESLPERFRPLSDRVNVVLTANASYSLPQGVMRFGSFDEAVDYFCNKEGQAFGDIFVIGGGAVYAEAIKNRACQKVYQTIIEKNFLCDTFFPEIPDFFKPVRQSEAIQEQNIRFSFFELTP